MFDLQRSNVSVAHAHESNIWLNVRSLLCCVSPDVTTANLQPALHLLHQSLPDVQITRINYANLVTSIQADSIQAEHSKQNRKDRLIALSKFDAAIIFTAPFQSPYTIAYLCYLAGIPIRIGQSCEFGGSVLSVSVAPPTDVASLEQYHLHLLYSIHLPQSVSNI